MENVLLSLVGESVNGICFVMDYVEIHFNGPILRCLSNPIILFHSKAIQFPASGSRDAICSLIGDVVTSVTVEEEVSIDINLKSGKLLKVPLDASSRKSDEAAHFVPGPDQPIQIW